MPWRTKGHLQRSGVCLALEAIGVTLSHEGAKQTFDNACNETTGARVVLSCDDAPSHAWREWAQPIIVDLKLRTPRMIGAPARVTAAQEHFGQCNSSEINSRLFR